MAALYIPHPSSAVVACSLLVVSMYNRAWPTSVFTQRFLAALITGLCIRTCLVRELWSVGSSSGALLSCDPVSGGLVLTASPACTQQREGMEGDPF